MDNLIALIIFLNNPNQWKEDIYQNKYEQAIQLHNNESNPQFDGILSGNISWYAKGLKNPEAFTTACWEDYPKGTKFKVTFNNKSVVVTCNDRGNFKQMGRVLDLSSGAFKQLSPLSIGIIRGAKIEVVK